MTTLVLGGWRSAGRLVDGFAASRWVVAAGRLLERNIAIVGAVVALIAVERLARGLLRDWVGCVLRRRRGWAVVLVVWIVLAVPSSLIVLRSGLALHDPTGAIPGLHAKAAATAVGDAAPGDEEEDEEKDDQPCENPAAPGVIAGRAIVVVLAVVAVAGKERC